MPEPVIRFDNVSFSYHTQDIPVLKNVSFQVTPGEFLGVIGPNGGGKTTLLKLVMGFLKPTSGTIKIFEQTPLLARNQIAYVPQSMRYDKQFPISVLELVLSGRLSHLPWHGMYNQHDKKLALATLEKVGLLNFANQPFGTLSGGQAQRVLIARALVSEPQLLLLDEPTASVDVEAGADICALLKELQNTMTMLMVSHDLGTIIRDVQRVICVQRDVYSFKPQEVCEHFALGLYHAPLMQTPNEKGHFKFYKPPSTESQSP